MQLRFFSSLRFRLILIMTFSVAPMLGLILHSCIKERARSFSKARLDAQEIARTVGRLQDLLIENAHQTLRSLSYLPLLETQDSETLTKIFARLIDESPNYTEFAAASPSGQIFASWPQVKKKIGFAGSARHKLFLKSARAKVGSYEFGCIGHRAEILVIYPVLDPAGRPKAMLLAGLNVGYLNRYLASTQYPAGTTINVVDSNGTVLANFPNQKNQIGRHILETFLLEIIRQRRMGVIDVSDRQGSASIYGFSAVGRGADSEYVVVGIPKSVVYANAERDLIQRLWLLLAVFLPVLAGTWYVGDVHILRKIRALLTAMKSVTGGDLSVRTGVTKSHGELNQLAKAFDQMAQSLEQWSVEARRRSNERLQRSEARLQLILDRMPIACIVWDTEFRVSLWNAAAQRVFGYREDEVMGQHPFDFISVRQAHDYVRGRWSELLAGNSPPVAINQNRTKDGSTIICEWSSTPVEGPDGSVVAVISMAQDITERKKTEETLLNLTRTLKMLSDCNQMLVRAQNESELLEKICRLIVEVGEYPLAWVGYAEHDDGKRIRPVSKWGHDEGYLEELAVTWSDAVSGRGPAGTAIRTGKPAISGDISADPNFVTKDAAARRGYASCVGLPLLIDDKAYGVVVIYSGEKHAFNTQESDLLVELAEDLAYGIRALRTQKEHGQMVQALRESEARFRKLYEEAPIAYQSLDKDGTIVATNKKWLDTLGYTESEVLGRWMGDFLTPSYTHSFRERFQRLNDMGQTRGIISEVLAKDGRTVSVEIDSTISYDESGRFKQAHCLLRDITDIKEAEGAIQALVESSVAITGDDYFDEIVSKLCEWLGVEIAMVGEFVDASNVRALSMKVDGVLSHGSLHTISRAPCEMMCEKGYSVYPEGVLKLFPQAGGLAKFGAEGYMGVPLKDRTGRNIGVLFAVSRHKLNPPKRAEDVMNILAAKTAAELRRVKMEAERERMERQLRQAQKMEAIGTLAGGIAHDFNNILGIIFGYSEMSRLDIPQDSVAYSYIGNVLKAADRAKELVQQILAFSRHSEQELRPLRLAPIIKEGLKLLRAALPSTIHIEQQIRTEEDTILGDPTQVHQLLMNLCSNAAQAMADGGGTLEVKLSAVRFEAEAGDRPDDLEPGAYVMMMVRDTGPGMSKAVLERVLEPYFTTKEPGEGTGLGLAVVHGIVTRYGGSITIDSRPGAGATFRLFFPRLEHEETPRGTEEETFLRGNETILVVDDEPALLDSVRQRLEYLGYRVISCTNGAEALETFRENPQKFDLVVTDQTMPLMTGTALARNLLGIRPETPIILCTGYSEYSTAQQLQALGVGELLMKPLNLRDLAAAVRRLMDGAGSGSPQL